YPAPPSPQTYTPSLHDALPISPTPTTSSTKRARTSSSCTTQRRTRCRRRSGTRRGTARCGRTGSVDRPFGEPLADYPRSPVLIRSEEHTSELQSQSNLVCRLLL